MPESQVFHMRPKARLIELLGNELVSDEAVAVVELVKNSYDADASQVTVRFFADEKGHVTKLRISDDGHGMTLDAVKHGWFEPGSTLKRDRRFSPLGRVLLGAKGIGRFASARLAKTLFMDTVSRSEDTRIQAVFDWGSFDSESYLDEIGIVYDLLPVEGRSPGTILELSRMRHESWSKEDYETIHTRLSRLVSPFQDVKDFKIMLEVAGHPEYSGLIETHELTLAPRYWLRGQVDENGQFIGTVHVDGKLVSKYSQHLLFGRPQTLASGAFEVEVRGWDRDREGLETFLARFDLGIREVRKILDTYCGVSIYRDGFRVHPYGEQGNDWLNLDSRSRQNPTLRLANNQIIAAIKISRSANERLKDRSTREGLVHNTAYTDLKRTLLEVLTLLESHRSKYRAATKRRQPSARGNLFAPFDVSQLVETAEHELGEDHPVTAAAKSADENIQQGVVNLEEYLSRLLLSAGLGQMVDVVIHEIGAPLGRLRRELEHIERTYAELDKECFELEIVDGITYMKGWFEEIHNLRDRLDPQIPAKRGRATKFTVREELESSFDLFSSLLKSKSITYTIHADDPVEVFMSRAVAGQVFANLIDNSIYWAYWRHRGEGGRISAALTRLPAGFQILFSDDGPGIPEDDREHIFEPYYTRKSSGMGLGLYLVRLMMDPYGTIELGTECELSGACFDVRFERNTGVKDD